MDLTSVSLVNSGDAYNDMFQGNNSQEVILGRYFSSVNRHWGYGLGYILFPAGSDGWSVTTPTQDLVDQYELTNGKVPADPTSGYDAQNPYVDRDPRFYASILYAGAPLRMALMKYMQVEKILIQVLRAETHPEPDTTTANGSMKIRRLVRLIPTPGLSSVCLSFT